MAPRLASPPEAFVPEPIGSIADSASLSPHASSPRRRWHVPWPSPSLVLIAIAVAAVVFAVWPQLDLAISRRFYRPGGLFVAVGLSFRDVRRAAYVAPFALCTVMCVAGILRWAGLRRLPGPDMRGVILLLASLALGPGLLVNAGLKDYAHRPRPAQVVEFGGDMKFRPFYRFDGACRTNCSFVSGEVSWAAWTLAPALLAPPPLRPVAVAAALAFAVGVGLLRIAAGGHFLSDAVFAILFMALVVLLLRRLIYPPGLLVRRRR